MLAVFGYISALLITIEFIPYIRDILRNKTKPQRTTWLIFSVLGVIAFFSQMAKVATDSLWFSGVITVGVTLIYLFSLKYGVGGFAKKDIISLTVADSTIVAAMILGKRRLTN